MTHIIKSVLELGISSPLFNQFYDLCLKMAVAHLCINRNRQIRDELLRKMDYSLKDLARDCIDSLFETKENRLVQINAYFFRKYDNSIDLLHNDELQASLAVLVISKTNQELSHLREDFGEIYFKVRKCLSTLLARKKGLYKQIFINDRNFIFNNHLDVLDFKADQFPQQELLYELYQKKFRSYQIPEVVESIFNTINSQNTYCKAISQELLLDILNSFYKSRLDSFTAQNVEYIINESECDE